MECVANLVSICLERERQQRCLRALFQDSVDAQLRLRADGTILAANSAAARFVGIPQPDLLGRSIEGLGLSERARGAWEIVLQQVHASGQALSFEFALQAAAGPVRCSARLLPIPDGTGSTEFVVGTLYDVTDRINHEQLANLQRQLHRREDRLDALLTNVLGERAVLRERARTWGLAGLTPREQTILRQMATGKTNRQIGAELGMSPGTVRNRISLLLPKLGAADRTQAAVVALRRGYI